VTYPPQSPLGQLPPAADMLGRRLLRFDSESGMASLEFLAKPEFANRHGSVQGGLLAATLDSATGAALMASLPPDLTAVTLQLSTFSSRSPSRAKRSRHGVTTTITCDRTAVSAP